MEAGMGLWEDFREVVLCNRSYRRFDEAVALDEATLRELVDLARLSPSAANLQPLKYVLVNSTDAREQVFPCLKWAAALRDWEGPAEGERPSAYIVVLGDTEAAKNFAYDQGIAAQTIMLGAVARGLGGCIMASITRGRLAEVLELDERFEILLVLALGKPVEQVKLEPVGEDGSLTYWRDENQIHHVPKRDLSELVLAVR